MIRNIILASIQSIQGTQRPIEVLDQPRTQKGSQERILKRCSKKGKLLCHKGLGGRCGEGGGAAGRGMELGHVGGAVEEVGEERAGYEVIFVFGSGMWMLG